MRLLKDRIRTSLWFAPAIAVAVAVTIAIVLVVVDPGSEIVLLSWLFFDGGPESARELLSTIASSMLTFTALVFSITVLVLQLASSQFSPRVIRTFLQSHVTKLTMAVFVGTFVYTMVVLSQVRTEPAFVPALATWVGLLLVVVSVGVFIQYVHHIAHSVRAITVITNIATETRHHIDEMCPEHPGEAAAELTLPPDEPAQLIYLDGRAGVFAAMKQDEILELARSAGAVVEVVPHLGEFLPSGALAFRVWSATIDEDAARAAFAIEPERTPAQDPGFGFRQLVDIAIRALSPGINDPSTAVQAIDHLHDLVRRLAPRRFPCKTHADGDGRLRLITAEAEFADFVELAFTELRHHGASTPRIRERLRRAVEDCLAVASPLHRQSLLHQLALLERLPRPRASASRA